MTNGLFGKILVVDDTTANLQLLIKILTEQGYVAYPASDGELALEFVQSNLPDIILLDIRMPGMDGYEVCRRLKADERTRSIPIIFISILEDERDKVKGFQAGGVDYITKPFQPEEVLARVRTHLRLQKLTVRLEQEVHARTEELTATNQRLHQELAERQRAEALLRESEERFRNMFEKHDAVMLLIDPISGRILDANPAAEKYYGYSLRKLKSMLIDDINNLSPEQVAQERKKAIHNNCNYFVFPHKLASGEIRTVEVRSSSISIHGKTVLFSIVQDITERKQIEKEREALIAQLEKALEEIKTLRGILPICSFCKNIRNDEGYYEQIDEYIHKHSGVDFSHTVCPACMKKHYPELEKSMRKDSSEE